MQKQDVYGLPCITALHWLNPNSRKVGRLVNHDYLMRKINAGNCKYCLGMLSQSAAWRQGIEHMRGEGGGGERKMSDSTLLCREATCPWRHHIHIFDTLSYQFSSLPFGNQGDLHAPTPESDVMKLT